MNGLDISEIRWRDTNVVASGGMEAMGKSMMDSIIFEFQDYVGRRSNSAPRKSKDKKDNDL